MILESFLFHPRKSNKAKTSKDRLIEVENGIQISIKCHFENKAYPTLLFFHGNGEINSDYDDIALIYNKEKINFIIMDYRGYGLSNGSPNIKNILTDSIIAFNFVKTILKEQHYINKLFLMGRSLGSACVLNIINTNSNLIAGLIIESGFANEKPLFHLIGMTPEQADFKLEDGFLNCNKIKNYFGPLLIIHAKEDHIIPYNQAKILYNSCLTKNKKLITINNADHNNIILKSPDQYFYEVINFINNN